MRGILITILLAISTAIYPTNYYVKVGGSDAAAGTSDGTAWETISKVNTVWAAGTFAAGDTIFFNRGDTWYGTITVTEAGTSGTPIVIGAYGTGAEPIIEGFVTLSSWTSTGDTIYYATLTAESATEMVIVDGVQYAKGRWPNDGTWVVVASRPSTTQIIGTDQEDTPNWTGAELVIRENRWTLTRHTISDHGNDTITFTPALTYNPTGYGYFVQNSQTALDVLGEWYHDHSANRLYLHLDATLPAVYTIRASALDYGVNVGTYENIVITDIYLRGFNKATVYANYGDYDAHGLKVDNCIISHSGGDAIYINRSSSDTISNNTISYSNHCAVTLWGNFGNYGSITDNTISYSGTIYGAAFNLYGATAANNAYDAIYTNPDNTTVSGNTVTNTGYIPINYRGENALIENNYISHYAYIKDDAGGIYVYDDENTGKRVLNNIILYGLGTDQGMNVNSATSAHGIYTDGESSNVHFEGNIIGHMATAGYHGNIPRSVTIVNNLFFECVQFLNMWKYTDAAGYITGMRITNNQFVSSEINEELPKVIFYQNSSDAHYTDMATEIAYFGTIDSNYYYLNTETAVHIIDTSGKEAAPRSLARWVTDFGHDTHSTIEIMDAYTLNSIGSNLLSNGDFASNINGWTATGSSVTWDSDELGSGGCIQMTSTQENYNFYWWQNDNLVTTAISGGVISSTNHYLLRFLGKSAIDEKTMGLKLYSTGTGLTKQRFFTVGNTNTQKDVLFSYPADVGSGATMRLVLCDDPVITYMDNVGLYVANVTLTDWDEYLHLLYNETASPRTWYTSATMTDPEGNEYTSVTLDPQEGIILIGNGDVSLVEIPETSGDGLFLKSGSNFMVDKNGKIMIIQ